MEELEEVWRVEERRFMASPPVQRLVAGDVSLAHYAAYLRETYFYTREDPQIQALCTAWFRGGERELVRPFLQHAISEVGHDAMALADLATLGYATDAIPGEEALPTTIAMVAYPYFAIQHRSAVSYLGYLYFLEFLPTSRGGDIAAALARAGVPPQAMSFLAEHQTADVHHTRLMSIYARELIKTPQALAEVSYSLRVTGALFEAMLSGAFKSIDDGTSALGLAAHTEATAQAELA
jgi:pyrroloquinoline quinone (PQQ) biosynthesis protein C